MKKDPYGELFAAMGRAGAGAARAGAVRLRFGVVLTPTPLKIDVGGTIQEAGRFYIAHRLTADYAARCSVSGSMQVSTSCGLGGSHSEMGVSGGTLRLQNTAALLKTGDLVLLLTDDDQTFTIIDKVVKL